MKHLTREQRYVIQSLSRRGISNTEIANELGIHKSNVGRELKRNSSLRGKYQAAKAHMYAQERKERFVYNRKFTKQIKSVVDQYLKTEQ